MTSNYEKFVLNEANGVGYTQTVSGNWTSDPKFVDDALDELASRAKIVESRTNADIYSATSPDQAMTLTASSPRVLYLDGTSVNNFAITLPNPSVLSAGDGFTFHVMSGKNVVIKDHNGDEFSQIENGSTIQIHKLASSGEFEGTLTVHADGDANAFFFNNMKLSKVANGTSATDAVNKSQLDAVMSQLFPTIFGTRSVPKKLNPNINSALAQMSTTASSQDIYVCGSSDAVSCNSNVVVGSVDAGTINGQRMCIIGVSTSTVELNSTTVNVGLNGSAVLGVDDTICLRWDASKWTEVSRNF
jgi:hypothetical protein